MWLFTLLGGYWCSKFKVCSALISISCDCLDNSSSLVYNKQSTWSYYALCCANKEETAIPSQNKNGTWCSDISKTPTLTSKVVGTLYRTKYYCNDYVDTIPPRTLAMTPGKTNLKIKFNVLMSVLSFILNE